MIKKSNPRSTPASGEAGFKENDTVNAKINAYISENPKHWAYIQSMPRERLERSLVLNEIQKNERRERMNEGILAKLDMNPEMKEHIEGVIQHLPEDQRERAKINLASQALRGPNKPRNPPASASNLHTSLSNPSYEPDQTKPPLRRRSPNHP